ncbi:cytochrome c biogenesis CcdA family protein [Celeribacter arenosi]|uniref:Cytochrome c biogenesis CcdA family protein n=1 Tax=Celeribacter arenosi TaxID=792649 RepID=A0ABP7KCE3_9RHOB
MDLIFAYGAGLLTLINPCVLPILPIVIAGSLQAGPRGPVWMALGMSVTFVAFGLLVNTIGYAIGLDQDRLSQIGALMMVAFGLILVVPRFSATFSTATAGLAATADTRIGGIETTGASGQFLTGALLGVVWSPCIGPTLGSAIGLASQGQSLLWAGAIMCAFAAGVSTLILALGYGARQALQARLRIFAERARPVLGWVFLCVGLAILLKLHHLIEAWAVASLPAWLIDLSVSL